MNKIKQTLKSKKYDLLIVATFMVGVLLIFATYAWFSAALDTKIKVINLVVSNDSGLSISFDGVNFGSSIQISEENIIDNLKNIYPNNTNQWPGLGMKPVSTNGIKNPNQDKFDIYATSGIRYRDRLKLKTYLTTGKVSEDVAGTSNSFVAFDIFLKNKTGSPMSDNLYLDDGTGITISKGHTDEIEGMLNSSRIGFLKIGSVPIKSSVNDIQNVKCNNACEAVIYEPYQTNHTAYSISKVQKYDIALFNGQYYPTYAMINEVYKINVRDVLDGSDTENFALQINRIDFSKPLFQIPDGITKVRVYIWIEGQDIDSLETSSSGADLTITINFIKDTAGYDYYNYN